MSDRELPDALALIDGLCALGGPDALIVQDLGLAAALHRRYPALPLHASTQMSFHSTLAVPLLRERGFTRVVLAREMRRGDVEAVARGRDWKPSCLRTARSASARAAAA